MFDVSSNVTSMEMKRNVRSLLTTRVQREYLSSYGRTSPFPRKSKTRACRGESLLPIDGLFSTWALVSITAGSLSARFSLFIYQWINRTDNGVRISWFVSFISLHSEWESQRDSRRWGKTVICTSSWIRLVRSHFYSTERSRRGHLANSVIRLRLKLVQSVGRNECDCITNARGNLAFFSHWPLFAFAVQSKTKEKERERENQTDPFITRHRRISHLIHSYLNFTLSTRSNNETNSSNTKMSSSGSPQPRSVSTEKRSFCWRSNYSF